MKPTRTFSRRPQAGFSLFEVIVVLILLSIFVGILSYPILGMLDSAEMRAERKKLALIASEIRSTFHNDLLESYNISAVTGEVSGACPVTLFDILPKDPADDLVNANSWFTRLANLRSGISLPTGGTVYNSSADVRDLTINHFRRRRLLILGPTNENEQLRYLLLSLMIPDNTPVNLTIPNPADTNPSSAAYKEWFDKIYLHDWGVANDGPEGWDNIWSGTSLHGYTFTQRVLAERIVQRRFFLTVNNQGEDAIGVYTNLRKLSDFSASDVLRDKINAGLSNQEFPNHVIIEGKQRTQGILDGRRVLIYTIYANDIDRQKALLFSFQMNETTVVTANAK
jgi:prepilin-type N-terminal cleavage/methylation domain-containing protein